MARVSYKDWITEDGLVKLEGYARDGLTDKQIAKNVGINPSTLYNWKKQHVEILEALKKGKEVVDRQVESALLKKALGGTAKTVTYKMVKLDEDVLKAKRVEFLKSYKLDHPDLTNQELTLAAVAQVPTYERIPITEVESEVLPDTTAIIYWLKNRKPDEWRDRKEITTNDQQPVNINFDIPKEAKDDEEQTNND